MKVDVETVLSRECKFKSTNRAGLYIMVFLILLNTCDIPYYVQKKLGPEFKKIDKRIERIEKKLGIEKEAENVRRPDYRSTER